VKRRRVRFLPAAENDLDRIFEAVLDAAGEATAFRYLARVTGYCLGFDLAGERGSIRDDMRPGLRIVGFERRLTLVFTVTDDEVVFLRILEAGRNVGDVL
jgi:toxin ParE1/3/4